MEDDKPDLREIAQELYDGGMYCNCDLDNWEPERVTGHSHVCKIHKRAMTMTYQDMIRLFANSKT